VAAAIASENLRKPDVLEAIEETKKKLVEYLPIDMLARVHVSGLEATRTIAIGQGADATTEEIPDYVARHKYLDSAYKIHGAYVSEPEKNGHGNTYNFFGNTQVRAVTVKYEEDLKKLLYETKKE
jgi:phage terminase small subunit